MIEKVGIRLRRGGCDVNGEALQKLTQAYKTQCKVEVPKTKGPLTEAFSFYRNGEYREAIVKFDEYLSTETEMEKKAKYQLVVAKIFYRDIKNFPKSRKYALAAAKSKPSWGAPYVLIGKLYASSGPLCGTGTGWASQVVTWPAIDKWNYAKKIDSSVSSEASKLINTYRKYMPSVEDIFSRNKKEGSSFRVGCWINENTTVRAAK
jgi:tetratricopeptide (TPR) repeat protein